MAEWTDGAVREALGLAADAERRDVAYTGIATDTRQLPEGSLFVALRGPNHDAHDYLEAAAVRGARGAVVERVPGGAPAGLAYYVVGDTLVALGELARHRRRRLGQRICAVTGTVGKTATKNMAAAVLGTRYRVHATAGNLNNLVGAPLTLLSAPPTAEVVVVEVGTNAPGEIARLAGIVEPDAAVITAVGAGHLEGLGSVAGVLEEKVSLLRALPPGGVAIVAEEPPELVARARELAPRLRVAGWGERADAVLRAESIRLDEEGFASFVWQGRAVRLNYRGRHNVRNALLALGVGVEWGIDAEAAVAALAVVAPEKLRSEVWRIGAITVIADCYNSNPESLAAAVDLLEAMPRRGGRVAVVGSMLELGAESGALHRRAAEQLAASCVDLIVATGEFVEAFRPLAPQLGERLVLAADPLEAYPALAERLRGGETVLLKGSRGVALERLIPLFERDWAGPAGRGTGNRSGAGNAAAPGRGE